MASILFSNAVAISRWHTLINEERLYRIVEANDLESAVKVLLENNYGGGEVLESFLNFTQLLQAEKKIVNEFAIDTIPENIGIECFFLFNDYYNIKMLLKSFVFGVKVEHLLEEGYVYANSLIKENIDKENFNISPFINPIIENIRAGDITEPGDLDIMVDKAMFADINNRLAKRETSKYIRKYFNDYIDSTNIINYLRVIESDSNFAMFKELFVNGGSINIDEFSQLESEGKSIENILENSIFKEFKNEFLNLSISELELFKENFLIEEIMRDKHEVLTEAPSIAFYLAKTNELKLLNYIFVCIKAGIPKDTIRKKVGKSYA